MVPILPDHDALLFVMYYAKQKKKIHLFLIISPKKAKCPSRLQTFPWNEIPEFHIPLACYSNNEIINGDNMDIN